jgi:hypothetical protein
LISIQTHTTRIWFANAKFPHGFEAKGLSSPGYEPVRARIGIKRPKGRIFPCESSDAGPAVLRNAAASQVRPEEAQGTAFLQSAPNNVRIDRPETFI